MGTRARIHGGGALRKFDRQIACLLRPCVSVVHSRRLTHILRILVFVVGAVCDVVVLVDLFVVAERRRVP